MTCADIIVGPRAPPQSPVVESASAGFAWVRPKPDLRIVKLDEHDRYLLRSLDRAIERLAEEWRPVLFVVGLPAHTAEVFSS